MYIHTYTHTYIHATRFKFAKSASADLPGRKPRWEWETQEFPKHRRRENMVGVNMVLA